MILKNCFWLEANEAIEYGLADEILQKAPQPVERADKEE